MNTLFSVAPHLPEGFTYSEHFISEKEEADLLQVISGIELHTFNFQGYEAKRKVATYGYDWNFTTRKLSKGIAIPVQLKGVIEKVANKFHIPSEDFVEVLITEYPPGSVINWHRDAPPFDLIAGISLLTDCKFRLRPHDKEKQSRNNIKTIEVKRCSLYTMQGEARSEWQHSITPVKNVRYSITLRTLKIKDEIRQL
jgi:alkylated DNA repair dioxygenase AlkB